MAIDKKILKKILLKRKKIQEELKSLGKPKIAEKISLGKINKFKEKVSLLTRTR